MFLGKIKILMFKYVFFCIGYFCCCFSFKFIQIFTEINIFEYNKKLIKLKYSFK